MAAHPAMSTSNLLLSATSASHQRHKSDTSRPSTATESIDDENTAHQEYGIDNEDADAIYVTVAGEKSKNVSARESQY
jgi:hypothetical protein